MKDVSDAGFDLGGEEIARNLRRIGDFKEAELRRTKIAIRDPEKSSNNKGGRDGKLDVKPTNSNFLPTKPSATE